MGLLVRCGEVREEDRYLRRWYVAVSLNVARDDMMG